MRLAVLALCALLPTAAAAQEAAPLSVREPVFQRQKTGEYRWLGGPGPYYPARAAQGRLNGSATLACRAAATGVLTDCAVVAEAPKGENFSDAALLMAKRGWLTAAPHLVDGQPVDGEEVLVTVPFQVRR